MHKLKADTLALMFARDILRTPTQSQFNQMAIIDDNSAKQIGQFIKTLSAELEALDDHTDVIRVLNMYKPELK